MCACDLFILQVDRRKHLCDAVQVFRDGLQGLAKHASQAFLEPLGELTRNAVPMRAKKKTWTKRKRPRLHSGEPEKFRPLTDHECSVRRNLREILTTVRGPANRRSTIFDVKSDRRQQDCTKKGMFLRNTVDSPQERQDSCDMCENTCVRPRVSYVLHTCSTCGCHSSSLTELFALLTKNELLAPH